MMMPQNSPRNKTNSFLGTETTGSDPMVDHIRTPRGSNPIIPPLQIGRGRYIRTSTEASRHRKVEAIREKESYKGFTGITLNTAPRPKTSPAQCHYRRKIQQKHSQGQQPSSEEIIQLTRQNPRNFTAVNNHGITHREYLAYPSDASDFNYHNMSVDLATSLARATAMEGPTQYYNSLCGNNPEALKTLLNNKRFGWPTNQYTGFHVRSYRKPPTAELLADLDNTRYGHHNHNRPKTAASQLSSRRLLVPQPFIYRGSANTGKRILYRPMTQPNPRRPSQDPIAFSDEVLEMYDRPIPVPAVPTDEKPSPDTEETKQNTTEDVKEDKPVSPTEVGAPSSSPTLPDTTAQTDTNTKNEEANAQTQDDSTVNEEKSESPTTTAPEISEVVPDTTPTSAEEVPTTTPPSDILHQPAYETAQIIGRLDTAMPIMKKTISNKEHTTGQTNNIKSSADTTLANNAANAAYTDEQMQLSPNIDIAIETDDGYIQPPEIDEIEEQEIFQPDSSDNESTHSGQSESLKGKARKNSISKRIQKLKIGEDAANTIKIEAEQRKKVLENLLEEHATLVKQISSSSMEEDNTI